MSCYISFRDVTFANATDTVTVTVTTDVASHLFARVTDTEPQIHLKSGQRRGYQFIEDLRFCFVVFTDYEQEEAGDTLTHTFIIPAFSYCVTKWFYFYGMIAGETCVSTSPVFEHHNIYIPPPVTHYYFQATNWTQSCRTTAGTWGAAWGGSRFRVNTQNQAPYYRLEARAYLTASYFIQRTWLDYDTSGLPNDKTIAEADLILWFYEKWNGAQDYPYNWFQKGVQVYPLDVNDWLSQNLITDYYGQIKRVDISLNVQTYIPLNASGIAWINKSGHTYFCARHQRDVLNVQPWVVGADGVHFRSTYYPTVEARPWLHVAVYT